MLRELAAILSDEQVIHGDAVRRAYDCDAYPLEKSQPVCVVLPHTTDEVAATIRFCVENEIPFTPRGAGTGLSGGATPARGGIILSTKRMTSILEVNVEDRWIHVQTGIPNARVSKAVAEFGLYFAPDPSSQSVCTIGGNIAENSGGPHTLKYGVTCPHVLQSRMVDAHGSVFDLGSLIPGGFGYDLLGVVVGSEGTFGIATEAWLKLTLSPPYIETMLVAFPSVRDATEAVSAIIASGVIPSALELMDHGIISALRAAFGLEYPEASQALLLVECDGKEVEVVDEARLIADLCKDQNAISIAIAHSEIERQKLWTARKKGIGAMGRIAPTIITHDGVIPRSKLPKMLESVYSICHENKIGVANLFHAGDGNLHPCLYFDDRDPDQVEAAIRAGEAIIEKCLELGGSITGEHGIGVEKIPLMRLMFTDDDLRLQFDVKRIFNDGDLCNPCKSLPNQKGCVEHRARRRGVAT